MTDLVDREADTSQGDPSLDLSPLPPVSDAELAALALAAEPDPVLPDDAVSFWTVAEPQTGLLPSWYMPAPAAGARRLRGWRRAMAWTLVVAFVAIDAVGLCSTYGPILHR